MSIEKKLYFSVKFLERNFPSRRDLSGSSFSDVLRKATKLYHRNWKRYPDIIKISLKQTYSY